MRVQYRSMARNNHRNGENPAVIWHPAFIEAIKLELEDYHDVLEIRSELQLCSEPLRIDCVIVKKAKDAVIRKNIAAIFRETNLFEYKSPDDYVSVAEFYKVYSYACLLISLEKIPVTSVTISFVESHYPRTLINHLREIRKFSVEEIIPGIYTVRGDILPIQIINNRRLSVEENLWLKGLSSRLSPLECLHVHTEVYRQDKAEYVKAYLYAITLANAQAIEEAMLMRKNAVTLDEVMERTGLAARWEARGEARAEERNSIDVAQRMINLGLPAETIVAVTLLDPEKVKALYQNRANVP